MYLGWGGRGEAPFNTLHWRKIHCAQPRGVDRSLSTFSLHPLRVTCSPLRLPVSDKLS